MAADKVVAEPGTITGSIGVYGGKMVTADFWKKLGIAWDEIHAGANATMWSFIFDYPPGAQRQVDLMLDAVYADFTAKATVARDLSPAERSEEHTSELQSLMRTSFAVLRLNKKK